jgi:hypothetical protein
MRCNYLIWVENTEIDSDDDDDVQVALELGDLSSEVERYILDRQPRNLARCIVRIN